MPSFNPFTSVASRNVCTLFEIRLDSDFIVFRGNESEAAGQLLKGEVVLCLREALKVEDVHLRLTANCRMAWLETKNTPTGIHSQKIDRTTEIFRHNWPTFVGGPPSHGQILAPGNYEWPFEIELDGNTAESVEGLYQTNITYFLKATISRGKLAKNIHTFKRVRIIRTLDPAALEFNHAMSVENIWPNKIEYSVVIPQKAIVFGSTIPLQMRFTPLLKGLELGDISAKLLETHDFSLSGTAIITRSHKCDRDVASWNFPVSREDHWHDNIEETGQEGWLVNKELPLPRKLTKCIQDCSVHGIKIRHKVKLTVALKNPDGHISELRATLPVTIFISPNIPLDDEGNLISQPAAESSNQSSSIQNEQMAPPGYGLHVLDQLYEDVDPSGMMTPGGFRTPPGAQSGLASPFYAQSRAGSQENLAQLANMGVTPAALSSRLQSVSLDASNRNSSYLSNGSHSGTATPYPQPQDGERTAESSPPRSVPLSRRTSDEARGVESGQSTPPEHEHVDLDLEELNKVPSYTTARKTHIPRVTSYPGMIALPDYQTAISAPNSPIRTPVADPTTNPMSTIDEDANLEPPEPAVETMSRSSSSNRHSIGLGAFLHSHSVMDSYRR